MITKPPDRKFEVRLGTKISYMLGFTKDDLSVLLKKTTPGCRAKYPVDLRAGFDSMYVYCDLVRNQMVGDTLAPLLRVVPVEGKFEDNIYREYNSPHYLPLVKMEFDSISIAIKDDKNRNVPFLAGKVTVKLHFRKRKINYL